VRDIYACQFALTADNAFDKAREEAAAWALDRYPGAERPSLDRDHAATLSPTDDVAWFLVAGEDGTARAWTLTYRHADSVDASLRWRVVLQLVDDGQGVRLTYRMSQESVEPRVRPAIEVPGRPRIVRDLARNLGGLVDRRVIDGHAEVVHSDGIPALAGFVRDAVRRLPIVALTQAGATGRCSTDPTYLANQLMGLAHVVIVAPATATFELTDRLGRNLAVFDGAVRLYWPGLVEGGDGYVHRLWLPSAVEFIDRREAADGRVNGFARHLLALIGGVAALRIPPDPVARELRREAEARVAAAERAEWRRLLDEQALPDEFAEEFDRRAKRIEELELDLEIAEEERALLQDETARLAYNIGTIQAAIATERGDDDSAVAPPATIPEAVERLAADHPDALVILQDAYESAAETRYRHIDRAAAALRAIGAVAQGWHDDSLGTSFESAFAERGFTFRTVGPVTQGRHPQEYGRTYGGGRVMLGPHVALGDGGSTDTIFRAYWYLDEAERRFVIGHVGRHLDDSTT
jgi:hypothetical protein